MSQRTAEINTPLGPLEFFTEFSALPERRHSLVVKPIQPRLPLGMSVAACFCVVLLTEASETPTGIVFKVRLRPSTPITASAEPGQGLEAQVWRSPYSVLAVGTEDVECLRARMSSDFDITNDAIGYSSDELSIKIPTIPSGKSLSLHFIVAWNEHTERNDLSCWYAVDIAHEAVILAMNGPRGS